MDLEEVYEKGEVLGDSPNWLATVWSMHCVTENISSPHRNSGESPKNSRTSKYIISVLNNIGLFLRKIAQIMNVV